MPFRFWKRGGGFKEDDAVWAEPQMPRGDQLPEAKALNPDHCFVAALGISGEQGLNLMNVNTANRRLKFESSIQILPKSLILNWWFKFEPAVGGSATQLKFIKFGLRTPGRRRWRRIWMR